MQIVAKFLVGLVALEHVYFLVLEMFLWDKPRTRKAFGMTEEAAAHTKVLAGNQGLYNGFLAAGLIWSLVAPAAYAAQLALFFLACVIVAGLYGGYSVGRRILLVQLLPAGSRSRRCCSPDSQCGRRGPSISTSRCAPHTVHATLQRWRRLKRLCGRCPRCGDAAARVAWRAGEHFGGCDVLRVMPRACGRTAN